jgi:long-chain fatty acid transport protein
MKKFVKTLVLAGLLCHTQSAEAAGFLLSEQSVSSMGTAFAANTAGVDDATTVYLNPAGMTSLPRPNDFVTGISWIIPNAKYHDKGTINVFGQPMGAAPCQHNTNGGQIGKNGWIPYFAYAKKFGCRWAAGITVNAPLGLATDYNDKWYGRYYATYSQVITTNINPALAYDITDNITIGAGISAQYLHLVNKNMVDFGAIAGVQQQNPALAEQLDGKTTLKGCAWGVGGNVGLLWKFNCDRTRIGVQYRSQIHYKVNNGHLRYHDRPSIFAATFPNTGAKASATMPDVVSAGIMHRWDDALTLYGDVQWTNWSTLNKLKVKFKNPGPLPGPQEAVTTFKWKSVWHFAAGLKYQLTCDLAFRLGYMYDQAPTRNAYYVSPRIPDADRQWVAFGIQYWATPCIAVDFGYTHLFIAKRKVDNRSGIPDDEEIRFRGGLYGRWKAWTDILGIQIHGSF